MEEADGEDHVPPGRAVNLLEELLGDEGSEGFVQPCLETFRGFVCNLDDLLQETEREFVVGLAGDPQSEILVWLDTLSAAEPNDGLFNLLHEPET